LRKSKTSQTRTVDELLQELVLFQHDPQLIDEIKIHAYAGNPHAQYGLGLIYAEGRGVDEDLVKSFAWLSVAIREGDQDAESLRYIVAERMNDVQLAEVDAMILLITKKIQANHYANKGHTIN